MPVIDFGYGLALIGWFDPQSAGSWHPEGTSEAAYVHCS